MDTKTIPFLDMSVTLEDGHFKTDLFVKSNSVCQYLLPSSCHPAHISKNIPYSLAYRLRRICSQDGDFEYRLEQLKRNLISRQYHPKIIDEAFEKVRAINRQEALKKVEKSKNDRPVLAITYHPALPSVAAILRTHWGVMTNQNADLKRCFPKPPMVAYRRAKNLKDHLVRAKISSKRRSARLRNGYAPCKRPCKNCLFSTPTTTHTCYRTKKTWNITAPINCNTENVIYKITCKKCPDFCYIGETKRRFRDRMAEHRGYITQKKDNNPIGKHFLTGHGKNPEQYLHAIAIERVLPRGKTQLRKRRESHWINNYQSVRYGANTRD